MDTHEHLVEPDNALPPVTISDLPSALSEACRRVGWNELTRVQAHAIPYMTTGRDVLVQSRTGSGKTGAFVLPLLERLDPEQACCQALILVPTRELARQVFEEAESLASHTDLRSVAVYGGVGYEPQLEALRAGAHIVIGTPGRILDHLLRGSMDLKRLKVLIFDEADRMLSMGFYPDMKAVDAYLPRQRDAFMFSATYPISVRRLSGQFLDEPGFLCLSHDAVHVADVEHVCYETPPMDKDRALVRVIEFENPESALIFCNTKAQVNYVATVLRRFGYDADQLTSDLAQGARERVLQRLRAHKLRFLVATDVAARGLDIEKLSHVIGYDVPEDPESYIHRMGRTGRAGLSGVALSFVSTVDRAGLERIRKRYKIDMEQREAPGDADVETLVAQRLTARLETRLRECDRPRLDRMQPFVPLARELAATDDGLALLAMALDDAYQSWQHAVGEGTANQTKTGDDAETQEPSPQDLKGRLEGRLKGRDRLQIERMQRFIPLARELATSDDEVALLAMVLDDESCRQPKDAALKRSGGSRRRSRRR